MTDCICKEFKCKDQVYQYTVYQQEEIPGPEIGSLGDICVSNDTQNFWIRYKDKWSLARLGSSATGVPVQRHPDPQHFRKRLNRKLSCWSQDSTFYRAEKAKHTNKARDAKNSWMLEAVSRLAPDYGRSKEILVALHDLHTDVFHEPRWVVEPPMFALDTRPDIATMFRDLSALCDDKLCLTDVSFCDAAHGHPVKDADVPTFIASIIGSTFSPPLPDEEPLLTAINFVPSPATPMGLIQYNMTPMPYGRDPAYQLEKNQGQIKWSTTIAPAGALTDIQPELDECIRYIVHIGGRSLWIIWPSTDYNLFIMAHNNPSTLGALDQLQGMEVFIVEQRLDHFIIPPSHYYACLALTPSFYSCSRIWPPK